MARFVKYYDLSGHWLSEKPQYAYWWMDLIYLACWEKKKFFINGLIIECDRGQLAWSQLKLAERWKCSRQNVRTFLNNLEKDSMIVQDFIQKSNHKNMIITICNYSEFQDIQPQNQPQANRKPTASQPQANPVQEIPEILEVLERDISASADIGLPKKTNGNKFTIPSFQEVSCYCQERNNKVNPAKFIDFYSSNGWKVGKNKMKDWRAAIRTWENNGIDKKEKFVMTSEVINADF